MWVPILPITRVMRSGPRLGIADFHRLPDVMYQGDGAPQDGPDKAAGNLHPLPMIVTLSLPRVCERREKAAGGERSSRHEPRRSTGQARGVTLFGSEDRFQPPAGGIDGLNCFGGPSPFRFPPSRGFSFTKTSACCASCNNWGLFSHPNRSIRASGTRTRGLALSRRCPRKPPVATASVR